MPDASINGFKHHWEEQGTGEPLVMIHGAAGSGASLIKHFDELSQDFRVIIPDLRGMGGSEHVPSIPPSAWVDDMVGLLDHLGLEKTHLYGVSLGARVVLRFAIDHPQRTRTLTMDSAIIANDPAGNAALNAGFDLANMPEERKATQRAQHGGDWETVLQNYVSIRNDPAVQEYYNLRATTPQVKAPTLIMRGDKDEPVHPLAHSVEIHRLIAGSRLAIYPNTATGLGGAAPEIMRKLLRDFVAEVSGVAAG